MSDLKPIATWDISLNTDCPGCGEMVDLLDYADFWDGRKLNLAEHDTDRTRGVEVQCPLCHHEWKVDLEW
jgi:hypothetical protein